MNTLPRLSTALLALARLLLTFLGYHAPVRLYGVRAFSGEMECLGFDTRAHAESYGRRYYGCNWIAFEYAAALPMARDRGIAPMRTVGGRACAQAAQAYSINGY